MFLKKIPLFLIIFLGVVFSILPACKAVQTTTTSKNVEATVPNNPQNDVIYSLILAKWQRDVHLYENFMLLFSASVTLMSPEMQQAYKTRFEQIQGVGEPDSKLIPSEGKNILSLVVNMYTSNHKFDDLNDNKIWNCTLVSQQKTLSPISILYYNNKDIFAPYFTLGSLWSREYVIQFELPDGNFDRNSLVFSMHSAIADAHYFWR